MMLRRLFAAVQATSRRRPLRSRSHSTARLSDILEELESRRLLAVQYLGVTHTNTDPAEERYSYNVRVTADGSGELWMRYNAQFNRIDFDENSSFSNTTNGVLIAPVGTPGITEAAPFSAPGTAAFRADWNTKGTLETFHSSRINVTGDPGTRVFLANGDPLPLALNISLGTSSSSEIILNGPVNTSSNSWAQEYTVSLSADSVVTAATLTHSNTVSLRARDGVEVRNTINAPVTSYVSDGDFQLIAGGVINGSTGIYVGQTGSGVGFGGEGGDILIDGTINGGSVTLQTNSAFKATNIVTGPSGLLSGGGSLTLFNAGLDGGTIDVTSRNYAVTNVNVGTPTKTNPDIGISINQTAGDLTIAAVPSSRGQILLSAKAADAQIIVKSDISTQAALSLDASKLVVSNPLSTAKGNIVLAGDTVSIGSNVFAGTGGIGNVQLTSRTGGVTVSSAAVVSAPNGIISVDAKTNLASQARLVAPTLALVAGGSMSLNSNADEVRATAGTGITIADSDSLVVRSAQTTSGPISVSAGALLDVVNATIIGTGSASLTGIAGVAIRDLRIKNGTATASSSLGNVRVTGTVTVEGVDNDLALAANVGNVIIDATANVSVADKIDLAAPQGRVLTPGAVKSVTVDTSGAGYTSAPTVTLNAGGGGVAEPAVAFRQLSGVRVLSGGTGYVTAPTVNIIGGGGSNARATAFVSGGTVTSILVTNPGSGYTSTPTVTFSGGSGSGATAEAMVGGVASISVTDPGAGYLIPPEVVISAGAGAQSGAVTVNSTGGITGINLAYGGADFGVPPTVEIFDSSGAGSGATATASLSSGVSTYLITKDGSGYTGAPIVTFSGGGGTGAVAEALIAGGIELTSAVPSNPGGNYSPGVKVEFTGGGGTGATAKATITGSVVGSTISSTSPRGSGYSSVPVVSVVGGGVGTGAMATAQLGLTAESFRLDNVPTNSTRRTYSRAPDVIFSPPSDANGTRATGRAILNDANQVAGILIENAGTGYLSGDSITATLSSSVPPVAGDWTQTFTYVPSQFTVSGITIDVQGTGYTTDAELTFSGGGVPTTVATGTALVRGSISSVVMENAGQGYTSAPTVSFIDPTGTGTGASATAALSAEVIGLRILNPGTGYTSAPKVTFTGGGGSGAEATVGLTKTVSGIVVGERGKGYDPATTTVRLTPVAGGGGAVTGAITVNAAGTISSINLSTPGTDYVTPPQVIITDVSGSGSGATATAVVGTDPALPTYRQVTGITVGGGGTGYNPETTTVTLKSAGSGATAVANLDTSGGLASITVTNSGTGYQSGAGAPIVRLVPYGRTATGTATIATAAITGIKVENGGSGYTVAPTVTIEGGGGSGAKASASVVAGVVTAITVTEQGSGYTGPVTVKVSGGGGTTATATALVGGVSTQTVAIDDNANYFNYAALPTVTFSGGDASPQATGTAVITDVATINAARLSWTALQSPLAAVTSQFRRLSVNLTGIGASLSLVSSSPLTLEGATTKDGSISVLAPSLTVTNAVTVGDFSSTRDKTITLAASSGDLVVDAAVGSLLAGAQVRTPLAKSITLTALQGGIGATATPGLLTTDSVVFTAAKSTTVRTNTKTISGSVSDSAANISVTQRDVDPTTGSVLPLEAALVSANGGNVSFDVDAPLAIGQITAGTGSITLAASTLLENTVDAAADLVGASAHLVAKTGTINLQTAVSSLSASAPQSTITISNVSAGGINAAPGIELVKIAGRNAVQIQSQSTITATDVSSSDGTVSLTASGPGSDVLLGNAVSTKGVVTIVADRNVGVIDRTGSAAVITTATARVTATTGAVTLRTDVDTLAIDAAGAIDVSELSEISLGEPTGAFVRSASGKVDVTAGGAIAAFNVQAAANAIRLESTNAGVSLGTVTAGTLSVFSRGDVSDKGFAGGVIDADTLTITGAGSPIDLTNQGNRIGTFSATNGAGSIALKDTTGGLVLGSITGGTVSIVSTGDRPVTQSGAMDAVNLTVNGVGNAIALDNAGNKIAVFASSNLGGDVYVRDTDADLAIAGITGGRVTVVAANAVTQALPIGATVLEVHGSGTGAITLDKDNTVGSFLSGNGTRSIYFKNTTGLNINGINGGSVILLAAGTVTQAASTAINATALQVHNYAAGVVTLNQNNNLGSVTVGNGSGDVYVKDVSGDLAVTGINGGSVILLTAGTVTQQANTAINATALQVHNYAPGAVTLNQKNNVSKLTVGNGTSDVTFNGIGKNLDITGINGGVVTLSGVETVTQSGVINASELKIYSAAGLGAITLDKANNVGGLTVGNGGGAVTFNNAASRVLDIGLINAGNVTLTAAGTITESSPTARINALSLTVSANGPTLSLDKSNNVVTLVSASNPGGDVTFVNTGTLTTGPVTAGTAAVGDGNILLKSDNGSINVNGNLTAKSDRVTLEARNGTFTLANGVVIDANMLVYYTKTNPNFGTGTTIPTIIASNGDLTITESGSITFGGYTTDGNVTITGSSVTINGLVQTTGLGKAVTITATAGNIAFVGVGAIDNLPARNGLTTLSAASGTIKSENGTKVSGATTSLTVGQAVAFPGTIDATTLTATGASTAISLTGNNTLGTVGITKGTDVVVNDTTGPLALSAISATGTVTVTAAGAVTQTGAISGSALSVAANGNPITLNTHNNNVASLTSSNGAGSIAFKDTAGGLVLAGITGGAVSIDTTGGAVSQTGAINATALAVNAAGQTITLNTHNNTVGSFASSNGAGSVAFKDTTGGLVLAGITGGTVSIDAAGGAVTQAGVVNATALTVNAAGQTISLNTQNNVLGSFSANNGAGSIALRDTIGDLTLNTVTSGPLTVVAAGTVLANQVRVTGNTTITTANRGGLDVGPQANGLLQSSGQLDLLGVAGQVRLINGGRIVGSPVLVNSAFTINVGGTVTTTDQLNQAVATVNTLPAIVGSTYEIVVGASLVLTQTIEANRPMTLKGSSPAITLSGSATATTGLVINAGASGSRINTLAFSGFSGTALQMTAAQGVAISGVTFNSSNYGLAISGASTRSTVTGNTFNSCPNAIVLSSATGVTIGGTAAGQSNRINSSARAGVFATGFCTGSSVIKTVFATTRVPYNVSGSRNLRIVR